MRPTYVVPAALLALAACAHEQPNAEAPVVAEAPPLPPPAPPREVPAPDPNALLAQFLSEPIAHFAFDRADLRPEDQQRLQQLAELMKKAPGARVQIAGNCDDRGTEEYNLQLGARRAEVAKKYIANLGIDATRIETISYGEERPVDPGHTEHAWALNRRDDGQALVATSSAN